MLADQPVDLGLPSHEVKIMPLADRCGTAPVEEGVVLLDPSDHSPGIGLGVTQVAAESRNHCWYVKHVGLPRVQCPASSIGPAR